MAYLLIFTADAKGVQTRAKSPITYLQAKGCLLGSWISTTGIARRTSRIKVVKPRLKLRGLSFEAGPANPHG